MARDFNREDPSPIALGRCHICASGNQVWRHKHFLLYDADLAQHLRENGLPPDTVSAILTWKHTMRSLYGGMVDEHGTPLSVWEARQLQHQQYAKIYHRHNEPRTERGRAITFNTFRILLTGTKSQHAHAWLGMLDSQFPNPPADEATWRDFVHFMGEFEKSASDADNAEYTQRADIQRVVSLVGGKI